MAARLFSFYTNLMAKAPIVTNCATGFFIAGLGDYLSQRYFERQSEPVFSWNHSRSLDMGIIRAAVITPFVLRWYPFLVWACPGSGAVRVLGRVVIDQLIGSPSVIILVFMANATLQGDLRGLPDRLRQQFAVTWRTGLQYWPIVHSFNFGFVPLHHQPLFAHFASVYWNAVLSYYANLKDDERETRALL
eukprot:gene8236-9083_t